MSEVLFKCRFPLDIGRARNIQGWMSDLELIWLAYQAYNATSICEVGSWRGRSTRALADNTKGTVVAIDTWEGSANELQQDVILQDKNPDWLLNEFLENMKDKTNLRFYRMHSQEAALIFPHEEFDFVFLDGSHEYKDIKNDIIMYKPLVKPGGILAGHDYRQPWDGVIQAVDELLPTATNPVDDIWSIRVRK